MHENHKREREMKIIDCKKKKNKAEQIIKEKTKGVYEHRKEEELKCREQATIRRLTHAILHCRSQC